VHGSALVIKEALRMHPAVALTLERLVPARGTKIKDYFIPENSVVGISAWVIHYDTAVFGEDVDCFCPERWEGGDELNDPERLKMMEKSFFPVSTDSFLVLLVATRTDIGAVWSRSAKLHRQK
jgi:cytochrome P450